MAVLEAHGLGVAWVASLPILQNVSFVLTPGFYGLVGANGAGKTTLLRVLAGELAPHEGGVRLRPTPATIVHCPQTVEELGADVLTLAANHDGSAAALKGRLALQDDQVERWPTLSPGERKRWQIGAALACDPDVLLLDEPTNHLDGDARDRLLEALARFRGIGVIVSHDRAVLEMLPRAILRVHDGALTMYAGSWSQAKASWERARTDRELAHARARATVRAAERRLDAVRRTHEATARSVGASSRMKNKNDHDARSMGIKVVAGWAEQRAGRAVQVVRHQLERAESQVPPITRDATVGGSLFASYERSPHPVFFHLDAPEVCVGKHVVLRNVRVNIGREERVRIIGNNGAGKTTLLTALTNAVHRDDRILWLPQELPPLADHRLIDDLRASNAAERGRVLAVFSALGSDPERLLRRSNGAALSPGEARKLALAAALGCQVRAMVLDEPTNHLDLPTIERLESALLDYPGCIVLVTHDEAFARSVTARTLRVERGTVDPAPLDPRSALPTRE